ncbi:hypothetical protein ACFPRL_16395 [Pseudoclavibacter helvolus]
MREGVLLAGRSSFRCLWPPLPLPSCPTVQRFAHKCSRGSGLSERCGG